MAAQPLAYYALTLTSSLQLSPLPVEQEKNYCLFESCCLHPGEDPVFRWEWEEILWLAYPTLSANQMNALTSHQFMYGLQQELQIKLLENDPVLRLEKMVSFTQKMQAIDRTRASGAHVAVTSSPESHDITKIAALVKAVSN